MGDNVIFDERPREKRIVDISNLWSVSQCPAGLMYFGTYYLEIVGFIFSLRYILTRRASFKHFFLTSAIVYIYRICETVIKATTNITH